MHFSLWTREIADERLAYFYEICACLRLELGYSSLSDGCEEVAFCVYTLGLCYLE